MTSNYLAARSRPGFDRQAEIVFKVAQISLGMGPEAVGYDERGAGQPVLTVAGKEAFLEVTPRRGGDERGSVLTAYPQGGNTALWFLTISGTAPQALVEAIALQAISAVLAGGAADLG